MKDVERKINQTLEVILCVSLPMTIGLSFLTTPVWKAFYGASVYGPITYRYLVFVAFATTLFTASTTTLQLLKEYKMVFVTLIVGLLLKSTLNIPFMYLANNLGIYPFYGAITATMLGFVTSAIIATVHIKRKFNISYKDVYSQFKHIVVGVALMLLSMFLLEVFIPLKVNSRILSILIAGLYALVGGSVYLFYMYKTKTLEKVFGKSILEKIKINYVEKEKRHKMKFKVLTESEFKNFSETHENESFMQTVELGHLKEELGDKVYYLGVLDGKKLLQRLFY